MKARGVTIVVHIDGDPSSRKYHLPLWSFEAGKWIAVTVPLLVMLTLPPFQMMYASEVSPIVVSLVIVTHA